MQLPEADEVFAVEYLPGQFDQRADSCAECVQLLSQAERRRPHGEGLSALRLGHAGGVAKIKHYLINPVESREASLDTRATLAENSGARTTSRPRASPAPWTARGA